jgi:hypothetical protein
MTIATVLMIKKYNLKVDFIYKMYALYLFLQIILSKICKLKERTN